MDENRLNGSVNINCDLEKNDNNISITTPQSLALLKNSDSTVRVENSQTILSVKQGSVLLKLNSTDQGREIKTGQGATIGTDKKITITPAFEQSEKSMHNENPVDVVKSENAKADEQENSVGIKIMNKITTQDSSEAAKFADTAENTDGLKITEIYKTEIFKGDFEIDKNDIDKNYSENGNFLISKEAANTGKFGIILQDKDKNHNAYISKRINHLVEQGKNYEITAQVFVFKEGGDWGSPALVVSKFVDLGSASYGQDKAQDLKIVGWQLLKVSCLFKPEDFSGDIFIGVRNFGFPGIVYVDNLIINEIR